MSNVPDKLICDVKLTVTDAAGIERATTINITVCGRAVCQFRNGMRTLVGRPRPEMRRPCGTSKAR